MGVLPVILVDARAAHVTIGHRPRVATSNQGSETLIRFGEILGVEEIG